MSDYSTFLVATPDKVALPTQAELQAELQSSEIPRKIGALKKAIMLMLAGEDMPKTLMTVIRYCITQDDHQLQKLLMLYWEVTRKHDAAGKLLPEMILVCNALRNNLIHPNEYIRGCTLRFLTKLREPELLEPLVPAIKGCLNYRGHPYVRRNAVLAVFSVYRHFKDLFYDAPEEIEKLLEEENDASTRRNAFVMLFQTAQDKALAYLAKNIDRVLSFGDGFSLILLELIRKVARADPSKKAKFIRIVFSLLDSPSLAVSFEAAATLIALSASPSAVRAAAGAWVKVLGKESDNNVKLIVLDRLASLRKKHAKVLRELVMDILRSLSNPNNDIRKRTLDIAMDLVYPRNVDEVMSMLKKEIVSTGAGKADGSTADPEDVKYRTMLIAAIHGCAVRFPDVAANAVHLLMDFLNGDGALIVIEFVREMVETYPDMRSSIISKLRDVMGEISASDVYRVALWLLGQYSESDEEVQQAIHTIRGCLGPMPLTSTWADFVASQRAAPAAGSEEKAVPGAKKGPVVLSDGTYATQSAVTDSRARLDDLEESDDLLPLLRKLLLKGDFFLGSVVASTLTKLALRVAEHHGRDSRHSKAVTVDAMLVMCNIIELGASGLAGTAAVLPASALATASKKQGGNVSTSAGGGGSTTTSTTSNTASSNGTRIDQDSFERIVLCIRVLGDPDASSAALSVLLRDCRSTFHSLLAERRARAAQAHKEGVAAFSATGAEMQQFASSANVDEKKADPAAKSQPDECLNLRILRLNRAGADDADLDDDSDLNKAAGQAVENFSERLKRVYQLTGFADPVYAEAYVRVAEFDVILEILLINRTDTTLTNMTVELSTMGDLKLVERPPTFTLGPKDSKTIKANIKVSSTETGHIFGNIVYDAVGSSATGDRTNVINLAEIHVDIMDYIHPATCSDADFRSMWADFEWENKVNVTTNVTNLQEFVHLIAKQTNMRILTPISALAGCNFLAANLYARSVFGEDALVNISVENRSDGSIKGHVRIRAKTQGVALSLGDRITTKQKA